MMWTSESLFLHKKGKARSDLKKIANSKKRRNKAKN
jgi:hypothetical protein